MVKFTTMIRDPIHGYINITDDEKQLIDTFPVQRLRYIAQCPGVKFVYPGATHSMLEHSLGVMQLAGEIASNLELDRDEVRILRLAGLLHDVGHGPFGHIFGAATNWNFLKQTEKILLESEIKDTLDKQDIRAISDILKGEGDKHYLHEIINGPIDADRLDYLIRDSYYTGTLYGQADILRIIGNLNILNGHLTIKEKAISAIENFHLMQYQMYSAVYFHHTSRAASVMLQKSLEYAREIYESSLNTTEEFLKLNDLIITARILELKPTSESLEWAKNLMDSVMKRKLYKVAYEKRFKETKIFPKSSIYMLENIIKEEADLSSHELFLDYLHFNIKPMHMLEKKFEELTETYLKTLNLLRIYCPPEKLTLVKEITEKRLETDFEIETKF